MLLFFVSVSFILCGTSRLLWSLIKLNTVESEAERGRKWFSLFPYEPIGLPSGTPEQRERRVADLHADAVNSPCELERASCVMNTTTASATASASLP